MKYSTKPQPFSFEERDKVTAIKKEEKIKKMMEEEEKARAFKAHPVPKASSLLNFVTTFKLVWYSKITFRFSLFYYLCIKL